MRWINCQEPMAAEEVRELMQQLIADCNAGGMSDGVSSFGTVRSA